jgi:hypothetical protein
VKAVARWLATLFRTRSAATTDLATLIHEKTGGNPLFVHEFFRRIVDDGLVVHNKYQDKWHYDLQAIRARHYTENVVTLVLEQLEELPDETRRLLGSIACLGGTGEMEMICRVVGMSMAEMRYALPAVMAQLIVLTEKEYAFTHDRVQEAAFALLDRMRKATFMTTASLLADAARQAAGNELLFRAVHHVTAALDSIQPAPQRQMFRELSLLAARRAKRTGDYLSALSYIQTARALGNAGTVSDFMLDIEEAGCEFALGHLERTRELCDAILGCPGGLTEKALAANLLVEVYIRQSDSRLALEAALCWLGIFGIQIGRYPEDADCDEAWKASVTARATRRKAACPALADGKPGNGSGDEPALQRQHLRQLHLPAPALFAALPHDAPDPRPRHHRRLHHGDGLVWRADWPPLRRVSPRVPVRHAGPRAGESPRLRCV